jgi:5-methylcytosine-specific restriction endonuclease McrA
LRKLSRPAAPECLSQNADTWANEFVAARQRNPGHTFSWRSNNCYQALRYQLSAMTQSHCAFCDGPLGTESRETVEHFRPKSRFPELAYHWPNLFPCCDVCQGNKLEKFDEALLKPDDQNYRFEDYFLVNYKTGALDALPTHAHRATVTTQLYGLNSEARKKARLREWEHYQRDPAPELDDYSYRFFLE